MNTNELLHEEEHSTHSLSHSLAHSLTQGLNTIKADAEGSLILEKMSSIDSEIEFIWLFHRQAAPLKVGAERKRWRRRSEPQRLRNFSVRHIINHKRQYLPQSPPIKLFCHSERLGIWAGFHWCGLAAFRHSETVLVMPNFEKVIKIVWHTECFFFFWKRKQPNQGDAVLSSQCRSAKLCTNR